MGLSFSAPISPVEPATSVASSSMPAGQLAQSAAQMPQIAGDASKIGDVFFQSIQNAPQVGARMAPPPKVSRESNKDKERKERRVKDVMKKQSFTMEASQGLATRQ